MIEKFLLRKSFLREFGCEITKYFEFLTKSFEEFSFYEKL